MTFRKMILLASCTLGPAAACRDTTGNETIRVASVVVTPANLTLYYVGETVRLTAEARDSSNAVLTGSTFGWTSSDTTKVRVSATGLVTAVAYGSATITATTGGVSGSATVSVTRLTSTPERLSAGDRRTCGLTSGGAAYCWGDNSGGQLGDGTTIERTSPAAVAGGLVFMVISTGSDYTCGLAADAVGYCWGSNYNAVLGEGSSGGSRSTPAAVSGGLTFQAIRGTSVSPLVVE